MSAPAIEVEALHFAYGDHQAVRGIDFEVAKGEILGFLGPNGAGKSTTVKMLIGLLGPDSGRLHILGLDMALKRATIQAQIGVSFEEKNLYPDMTAQENLRFHARLFGIRKPDVDGLLRRVGLADRGGDRVDKYSKGMRQRLMLARALVNRPDVLFLDEPTDGLDPVSSRTIRDLVRQEAERGVAVVLTTHDMAEADELCDRVAFIDQGLIVALDTPEELKLKHGKRAVKVRSRRAGQVIEQVVELDGPDVGRRLGSAVSVEGLMTIHTEEATLENIFVQLTGRGLVG